MAYLYDTGRFMPKSVDEVAEMSWLVSWPNGPWHMHDIEIGGTVYLVTLARRSASCGAPR